MKPAFFDRFIEHKLTLASAESITGGLFGANITQYPSASRFYLGGFIVYNDEVKHQLLGISREALKEYKAISKEIALSLANHTLERLKSDVALAIVGNAGPDTQDDQPLGRIYMALVSKDEAHVYQDDLKGERSAIQMQCVALANQRLNEYLDKRENT